MTARSLSELRELGENAKKALLGAHLTEYDTETKAWLRASFRADRFEEVERVVAEWAALLDRLEAAERVAEAALAWAVNPGEGIHPDTFAQLRELRKIAKAWRPPGPEGAA